MERKVAYAKIKELGLQEEVKKQFGDNYTRVPTDKLEAVISQHSSGAVPNSAPAKLNEKADEKKLSESFYSLKNFLVYLLYQQTLP